MTVAFAMTLDLLVCPGCRTLHGDRLDVRTLERLGDLLACDCGRRYPVIDGVPIVLASPAAYLAGELATVVERDLAPEISALLALELTDDAPYARLLEHLSIYLDAHWGDRATPPPEATSARPSDLAVAPLLERIVGLPRVGLAVELGCSVGRVLAEVPAERAIGIDMHVGALRRARRLLAGESLAYPRRMIGRHYEPATIAASAPADGRRVVCSDVLDPPLLPDAFDRVVALNMLDSVVHPARLLSVIDGLCAPGGEIILACPYQWQSSVMAEDERLGGADPAGWLTRLLTAGEGLRRPYTIEEEAEIAWTLRRDARSTICYRTHYVRARKGT